MPRIVAALPAVQLDKLGRTERVRPRSLSGEQLVTRSVGTSPAL